MQSFFAEHFTFVYSAEGWVALATLVAMEIVLGIDNLIFISILSNKLPEADRSRARRLGIGAALVMRLLLLATVSYIAQLTAPVFTLMNHGFSWRDMILIAGGLFLVWKATKEIHHTVEERRDLSHLVRVCRRTDQPPQRATVAHRIVGRSGGGSPTSAACSDMIVSIPPDASSSRVSSSLRRNATPSAVP